MSSARTGSGNIFDLMERLSQQDDDPPGGSPLPEAQIMTLKELFADYRSTDRFSPGDIVMRRRSVGGRHHGTPCIVLETNKHAEPIYLISENGIASQLSGQRHDIRVLMLINGDACPFWVESYELEPYREDDGSPKNDTNQGQAGSLN